MSIEDLTGTVVRKICMACSREFASSGGTCPHDGNMLVPLPQDPYVGRRIADKYHVLSVLGTGGMGVVYLARHETMQDNVAIKMLRAQFVGDHASVKRFNHEAIAARRLRHPNVITTYDHGCTHQGQPYIVMECLHGVSLADEIKRLKQLPVDRVLHIFMQACDALDHAHKQGVIHRDLKPGNFMLINFNDDPDFVKVVDFGVAKVLPINNENSQTLTQAGEVCGSPVYMSPEQCQGQPLDRRADIYSMGIVLYEALTGKLPLIGRNMVETMHKHINERPAAFKEARPDLYIPERLEQVVMRALSKSPDMRQQNMAILKQELMFCVPRPGTQNTNLRSIASTIDTPSGDKKAWLVPAIVAGSIALIGIIAAVVFFLNQKSSLPAVTSPVFTQPALNTTQAITNTSPVRTGVNLLRSGQPVQSNVGRIQSDIVPPDGLRSIPAVHTNSSSIPSKASPKVYQTPVVPLPTKPAPPVVAQRDSTRIKRIQRNASGPKRAVATTHVASSHPAQSSVGKKKDPFAELAGHLSYKKKQD